MIFLQPVLFLLRHKSLSFWIWMYTSGRKSLTFRRVILERQKWSSFEIVIFCKRHSDRPVQRGEGNWRVCSLCCVDLWGQGQEGSRQTQRQTGTEVCFFYIISILVSNQPQIMRFIVLHRNEKDTIISEESPHTLSSQLSVLFIFRFVFFLNLL